VGAYRDASDDAYAALEASNDVYAATTAQTLRLVEPWFRTGRIVDMDAWFMSMICLMALHRHGLFSMGIVKTGQYFPKDYLLQWVRKYGPNETPAPRGTTLCMTTTYVLNGENFPAAAILWQDKTSKAILSNVGHTQQVAETI
jgi:hypothetical protein